VTALSGDEGDEETALELPGVDLDLEVDIHHRTLSSLAVEYGIAKMHRR
jgi:hypothetical protein